ncbi:hypothetical protein W04_1714 [Pseudoalteromonas sp. SW0106-04]|nr:hypothetical protein W04_1714 [Pseudoalteromonas sp. SW0106-04]
MALCQKYGNLATELKLNRQGTNMLHLYKFNDMPGNGNGDDDKTEKLQQIKK